MILIEDCPFSASTQQRLDMRWSVNFLAAALLAVGNCVPLESELVERAVGTNGSGSSTTSLNYTATLAPKPTSEAPAARGFGHPGPPPNFPPGPPPNFPPGPPNFPPGPPPNFPPGPPNFPAGPPPSFPPGPPNFPAGPPPSFPPGPPNFPPPKKPVKPEDASITCKDPAFQKEKKVVYDFLNNFWTAFLNPNDSVEALKINSTYFTENSLGRVSLTRDFTGVELNTEYIFGLFSDVYDVKFRMNGVPKNYTLVNFVYDNHVAVVSAILDYYIKAIDFHIPIQIDMWYYLVFNDDGTIQIDEYDAVFRNFDWAYEITNGLVLEALHQKFPTKNNTLVYKQLAVDSICTVHTQYCTGENKQYDNYNACYKFLMEDVRIGAAYEGGRDTIFCRNIHQVMLPFRPSVHCPHIGPSGGGMCTDPDTTYNSMLESYSSYFTKLYDSRNHFQ